MTTISNKIFCRSIWWSIFKITFISDSLICCVEHRTWFVCVYFYVTPLSFANNILLTITKTIKNQKSTSFSEYFILISSQARKANAQTITIHSTCLKLSLLHDELVWAFELLHASVQLNDGTSSSFPVNMWPRLKVMFIQIGIIL